MPKTMRILKIWRDDSADSPRSWDNLGTMVCWHKRYSLGDRHDFETPQDFLDWAKRADIAVMLPLYLYDHGGLSMSTCGWRYPYNDPWDAGQVGWIYVTKSKLREERRVKRVTKKTISWAEDILRAEVETYDQYLRGEVYGFTAYEIQDGDIAEIDSCGGFFGSDPEQNGMLDYVPRELCEVLRSVKFLYDGLVITETGEERRTGPEVLRYLREHGLLPANVLGKHELICELVGWN